MGDARRTWRCRATGRVEPVVVWIQTRLPSEPVLPALFGQKILLLESHLQRKFLGAGSDKQDVIGVVHHGFRDLRRCRDILERRNRASAFRRSMHARCVVGGFRSKGSQNPGIRAAACR